MGRALPTGRRRYWGEMMTIAKLDSATLPSFEELVAAHVDLVYGAALRQVRDPHLADDVTQAVFLVLARKRDRLPVEAVLAPWLLKVTRYTALTALRAQRRRRHYEALGGAAREIPPTETKSESPEAALVERENSIGALLDEARPHGPGRGGSAADRAAIFAESAAGGSGGGAAAADQYSGQAGGAGAGADATLFHAARSDGAGGHVGCGDGQSGRSNRPPACGSGSGAKSQTAWAFRRRRVLFLWE